MRLDDHLRHVGDERDGRIVLLGCELDERGAEVEDEVVDRRGVLVRDVSVVDHHPRATDEQVGASRHRPAPFASRHRVRADVARHVGAAVAEVLVDGDLHARDIRHDRLGERLELGGDDVGRDVGRNAHDDELRPVAGRGRPPGAVVDRDREVRRRRVGEDHLDAPGPQPQADARAEQADADDAHRSGQA